jgi:hypothetical protein
MLKIIKDKIESHGSLKKLLSKIEDLTLEYDEDYQDSATIPGMYCIIKSKLMCCLPQINYIIPGYLVSNILYDHNKSIV